MSLRHSLQNKPGTTWNTGVPQRAVRPGTSAASAWLPSTAPALGGFLQRKCTCGNVMAGAGECESCARQKGTLQRRATNEGAVGEIPAIVHDVLRSPGQPLDAATRATMEPQLGHDFSGVLVHSDAKANASARAINASAYTVGRNVVFGAGEYAPSTAAGKKLLAHELTHVVQQRFAPTAPSHDLAIGDPADSLEAEAERAEHAVAVPHATHTPGAAAVSPRLAAKPLIQRQGAGAAPNLFPRLNLPVDSADIATTESVAADNPSLVKLAAAYKTQSAGNPNAYLTLSGYLNVAASASSSGEATERSRMLTRLTAVRSALETLGVPRAAMTVEAPTEFSSNAGGKIHIGLYKERQSLTGSLPIGPVPAPKQPAPNAPPATPGLADMLTFDFRAGPVPISVELPKSVTAKLPVALGIAKSLEFELKAESSGTFSFSVTVDEKQHFRVIAKAQVGVDKDKGTSGKAGLEIQATHTVCSAANPDVLKAQIQKSGEKLQKAMQDWKTAQPGERPGKLVDIASAIGDMYDAVDKSKSACKQVPAVSVGFGVQGPISPTNAAINDPDPTKRPEAYIGGTISIPF